MMWLALLLALGTVTALAYPLFRGRAQAVPPGDDALGAAKEATYAAIKELEFDYRAGSLSAEDYQDLVARYKRKAASLLRDTEAREQGADLRAQVEEEVRQLRQRGVGTEIEAEVRQRPTVRFCTRCGAPSAPGDRFCSQCGQTLREGGTP